MSSKDRERAIVELEQLIKKHIPERDRKRLSWYVNTIRRKELDYFFENEEKEAQRNYDRFIKTFSVHFEIPPANFGLYGGKFRGHDGVLLKDLGNLKRGSKFDRVLAYPSEEKDFMIVRVWNDAITDAGPSEEILFDGKVPYLFY